MCAVPVAVAAVAMSPWGNGWNYFIGGAIAALTGPPACFIVKAIYGGKKRLAADANAALPGEHSAVEPNDG